MQYVVCCVLCVLACKMNILTCYIFRDGSRYFSKVTSYILLITSNNVTRHSYIIQVTSNMLHITFSLAYCKSHLFSGKNH